MRKFHFIAFFFLSFSQVRSQNRTIDSLVGTLRTAKEDTNKAYTLNWIASELMDIEPEKGIAYSKQALGLSQKLGYLRGEAVAKTSIGGVYLRTGKYKEALLYLNEGLDIHRKTGYKISESIALQNIGLVYMSIGKYPEAIKSQLASLKIKEALGEKEMMISAYINIGSIYMEQKIYDDALKYFELALKLANELNEKNGMAYSHNSIGNIYAAQNKHKEALIDFEKAFALWKSIDFTPGFVGSYISIAQQQYELGNLIKSQENYMEACALAIKLDDRRALQSAYLGLAYLFVKKKEYSKAKSYFEKSLVFAKKMNAQKQLKEVYEGLSKLELAQGNYQGALSNYEMSVLYKDSIINDDNNQKLLQAQMQYDFDKEQAVKDGIAQEELRIANFQRYASMGLAALILIFSLVMVNRFWVTRKQKRIIQAEKDRGDELLKLTDAQNTELEKLNGVKNRLFSVISHDLRSPVNSLVSFTQLLEGGNVPPEKLGRYSLELNKTLTGTSKLLDNLLQWAATQMQGTKPVMEEVNIAEVLQNELNTLKPVADEKQIILQNDLSESLTVQADTNMLALILRNLVSNAIKFSNRNSSIKINHTVEANKVRITVTDSGLGIDPSLVQEFNQFASVQPLKTSFGTDNEKGTGMGLMLCKTYAEAMGGSILLESVLGEGSKFTVVI